jgi:hypothetical protein
MFDGLRPVRKRIGQMTPAFRSITIGYLDPELNLEGDFFGLIVNTHLSHSDAQSIFRTQSGDGPIPLRFFLEQIARATDARLPDETVDLQEELDHFTWPAPYGGDLPVTYRGWSEFQTSVPDHPQSGTASCWARSRVRQPFPPEGLLTARHVLDQLMGQDVALGDWIPMTKGGSAPVCDLAPQPIDAAIIEVQFPKDLQHLHLQPYVAQWMPVEICTKRGNLNNLVIGVTDTYNVWNSPDVPAYLELDTPGMPGDSGSLVIDSTTGGAAGLYRGVFAASYPAAVHGRAAHMRQLAEMMDMELYQ